MNLDGIAAFLEANGLWEALESARARLAPAATSCREGEEETWHESENGGSTGPMKRRGETGGAPSSTRQRVAGWISGEKQELRSSK